MQTGKQSQAGFTYASLLVAVVLFGLASVGAARLLASTDRAEREAELLFIGHQFRQAIRSYLESGPKVGQYPPTLDELLQDSRNPTTRRHLRRMFVDPITGKAEWGIITAPEGGVMGIYSLSSREPKKRSGFDPEDADFALKLQQQPVGDAAKVNGLQPMTAAASAMQPMPLGTEPYSYRDWRFIYRPAATAVSRTSLGR
jgi:type II secretory pathway pseudopilin PulG